MEDLEFRRLKRLTLSNREDRPPLSRLRSTCNVDLGYAPQFMQAELISDISYYIVDIQDEANDQFQRRARLRKEIAITWPRSLASVDLLTPEGRDIHIHLAEGNEFASVLWDEESDIADIAEEGIETIVINGPFVDYLILGKCASDQPKNFDSFMGRIDQTARSIGIAPEDMLMLYGPETLVKLGCRTESMRVSMPLEELYQYDTSDLRDVFRKLTGISESKGQKEDTPPIATAQVDPPLRQKAFEVYRGEPDNHKQIVKCLQEESLGDEQIPDVVRFPWQRTSRGKTIGVVSFTQAVWLPVWKLENLESVPKEPPDITREGDDEKEAIS